MTHRDVQRRLEEVRRRMREHHAGVEPDASFARRVAAGLPDRDESGLSWAARRVLPVSVAAAVVLAAVLAVGGRASPGSATNGSATAAVSSSGDDWLSWVLEGRESR